MFEQPQLPDTPASSPSTLKRLKLPLGIACGVLVGVAGASLFLRGGPPATSAPTVPIEKEKEVAAAAPTNTPQAQPDSPAVPEITLPQTRSNFFDQAPRDASKKASGPNRQDGGVNEAPQPEYKLPPALQRFKDNQEAEERDRRARDARIHEVRVAAGADAPTAEEQKELDRMKALQRLMEQIATARRSRDAKSETALSTSLFPDERDLSLLLSESAPQGLKPFAERVLKDIKQHADELTTAGGFYIIDEKLSAVSVAKTKPEAIEDEPLTKWLKPDAKLFSVRWHEPEKSGGTSNPWFFWNGERWVDANYLAAAAQKFK